MQSKPLSQCTVSTFHLRFSAQSRYLKTFARLEALPNWKHSTSL